MVFLFSRTVLSYCLFLLPEIFRITTFLGKTLTFLSFYLFSVIQFSKNKLPEKSVDLSKLNRNLQRTSRFIFSFSLERR